MADANDWGVIDHDELHERLPDLDPVQAAFFAAQPILSTLIRLPSMVEVCQRATAPERAESIKVRAIKHLERLPEDIARLEQYLTPAVSQLLDQATPEPTALGEDCARHHCDLVLVIGRRLYAFALTPLRYEVTVDEGESPTPEAESEMRLARVDARLCRGRNVF